MNHLNIMIVAEKNHPLYGPLSRAYKVRTMDEAINTFETCELIFDLSALRTEKKNLFLSELAKTTRAPIISDLSLCWGEWIMKNCPQVCAAISTLFYSPRSAFEYFLRPSCGDIIRNQIDYFAATTHMEMIEHFDLELCFYFPRTVAMIINEAYFALEEKLAPKEIIDQALKLGVNYPLGPFEWAEKIGPHYVAELLEELKQITQDQRYNLSKALKLEAYNNLKTQDGIL